MKHFYPAVIHKDPDSDFGISFPDFPGCISAGDTVEDAIAMGTEALNGHIEVMNDENYALPQPTPVDTLSPEARDGAVAVVLVPAVLPGKPKRVNIMLDQNLLDEIAAETSNRSRFMSEAARNELIRRRGAP